MKNRSEQILVLRLKSGDAEALSEIYRNLAKPIYRFIYFRIGHEQVAEELMQEAFAKFIEIVDKSHIDSVSSYIYRIARNLVTDYHRASRQNRVTGLADVSEQQLQQSPTARSKGQSELQAEVELLRNAILQLKPAWQEIVVLKLVEGQTYEEIASLLNKSKAYIRVNFYRARKQLGKLLE